MSFGNFAVTCSGGEQDEIHWGEDGMLHFFAHANEDVRECELNLDEETEFAYDPVRRRAEKAGRPVKMPSR